LEGQEGVFLACTFWLAECLAKQGRRREALRVFKNGTAAANDLGLFAEQYDPRRKEMLGNFPQGLTHLAHVSAALALDSKPSRRRPSAAKKPSRRKRSKKRAQ
jgi:GH15 family glucan-1,4-alpha-glucosidase